MIETIIVSNDRPAQLHLLLDSIHLNGGNLFRITVLYKASSDYFQEGYRRAIEHFYNKTKRSYLFPITWKKRKKKNLKKDILKITKKSTGLVALFKDDNILFDRVSSYKKITKLFEENDLCSLSLRLGNNTVLQNPYEPGNYHIDKPSEGSFELDRFLVWNASSLRSFTNFAMPFSLNGHIYKKDVIEGALSRSKIVDEEDFELVLQTNLYAGMLNDMPSHMSCPEYSVVVSNSCDKISDKTNFDTTDLGINHRYVEGLTIQYSKYNFKHVSKPYTNFTTHFS